MRPDHGSLPLADFQRPLFNLAGIELKIQSAQPRNEIRSDLLTGQTWTCKQRRWRTGPLPWISERCPTRSRTVPKIKESARTWDPADRQVRPRDSTFNWGSLLTVLATPSVRVRVRSTCTTTVPPAGILGSERSALRWAPRPFAARASVADGSQRLGAVRRIAHHQARRLVLVVLAGQPQFDRPRGAEISPPCLALRLTRNDPHLCPCGRTARQVRVVCRCVGRCRPRAGDVDPCVDPMGVAARAQGSG